MEYTFQSDRRVARYYAGMWVYVKRRWMSMPGINRNSDTPIISCCIVAMGSVLPILMANSWEVALSNINPPKITPVDWQAACIMLMSLAFFNYFKHRASNDISCKLNPKYINMHRMANNCALLCCVKKQHTNTIKFVNIWLVIIHVFLFPYPMFEYFYRIGAVRNFNENGNTLKENKLRVM